MKTQLRSHLRRRAAFAAAILLTLGASLARAQIAIYARISDGTGVWAGPYSDGFRTGWAPLRDVSFGATNPITPGGASATTTFNPVKAGKIVDRLSPQIFITLAGGTPLNNVQPGVADVTIEFVRVVNAIPAVFFRMELRQVVFNSLSTAGADGDSEVIEAFEIRGSAMRYTFWNINPNGTQGTSSVRAWNTLTATPTF